MDTGVNPWWTPEQFAALVATLVGAVIVLLKLDVSDAQQGALVTLLATAYGIFVLVHGALVRKAALQATPHGEALVTQARARRG
jgi:hypothetical protein